MVVAQLILVLACMTGAFAINTPAREVSLTPPRHAHDVKTVGSVSLMVDVLELLGLTVQQTFESDALARSFMQLESVVRDGIEQGGGGGYLLLHQRFVGPSGQVQGVSRDNLLIPIGQGFGPLEAYVEALRQPALPRPLAPPPHLRDESRYYWIVQDSQGELRGSHILDRRSFERRGFDIYVRIETLARPPLAEAGHFSARANFWSEIVRERQHLVSGVERQQRLAESAARMKQLAMALEGNYAHYKSIENAMRKHQSRLAILSVTDNVLSLVSGAARAGVLGPTEPAPSGDGVIWFYDESVPLSDDAAEIRLQLDDLERQLGAATRDVNELVDRLNQQQQAIQDQFSVDRVSVPSMPPLPNVQPSFPMGGPR